MPASQTLRKLPKIQTRFAAGLSLLEVLICLSVLAMAILPLMLNLTSAGSNTTTAYVQASRSMLINSIMDNLDPEDPTFVTDYDMGTTKDSSTYTESGRPITFLRRVDNNANCLGAGLPCSSAMKRRVYLSLYQNASDSAASPFYQTAQDIGVDDLFIDVGASSAMTDESSRLWLPDAVYSSANHVPGYVSGFGGSTGSSASDVLNINNTNDPIYQTYRDGADMRFGVTVEPGNYVVKLYFCEFLNTVTAAAPNLRRADIAIGDASDFTTLPVKITNFSPYETTGATYKAQVVSFEVNVPTSSATKSINIRVTSAAAGTDLTPRISGISVHRM